MAEAGGRVAAVTGGTGQLGRAVVAALLGGGDRVVVPWIDRGECDALREHCASEVQAGQLQLFQADIAEDSGAAEFAERARGAQVLINGVGGFAGGAAFADTELATWDAMYRINLRSAVAATRALLPDLLRGDDAVIINVTSQAAAHPPATLGAYAAAKAGVIAFTTSLQAELAARGARVNAVAPATLDTPTNRAAMPDADFTTWTPPERVAQVIAWLASPAARAVRGAIIPV